MVKIFVCTHKSFDPPKDPMYVPLQVGRAGKEDLGYLCDNTGDNISERNCYYSELTGLYWAARNVHDADIKGSCHYRRYLINEKEKAYTEKEIREILSEYDIMTTRLLILPHGYLEGFSGDHNPKDLLLAGEIIGEICPEYKATFDELLHSKRTYFGNMIICRAELFDAYVDWLFSIFFRMEPRMDFSGYDGYTTRVYGFISEFLLQVYCKVQGLRVHESLVGLTEEKKETAETRRKLRDFIMAHQLTEAKDYFMSVAEKRPDILMEASDVNGSLKLAMQIISTCEHEEATYGDTILHHVTEYSQLTSHFEEINRLVLSDTYHHQVTKAGFEITPLAWEIGTMLIVDKSTRP